MIPTIEPTDADILLGRSKRTFHHPGNKKFRSFIRKNVHRYVNAVNRIDKTMVFKSLLDSIAAHGQRFLKQNAAKQWVDVSKGRITRDKVSHAIRDAACFLANSKQQKSSGLERLVYGKKSGVHHQLAPTIKSLKTRTTSQLVDDKMITLLQEESCSSLKPPAIMVARTLSTALDTPVPSHGGGPFQGNQQQRSLQDLLLDSTLTNDSVVEPITPFSMDEFLLPRRDTEQSSFYGFPAGFVWDEDTESMISNDDSDPLEAQLLNDCDLLEPLNWRLESVDHPNLERWWLLGDVLQKAIDMCQHDA
jgi:hypothetical protein